jgi:cytosine/adenosine deaminase-related metal-dependent hydrolase
LVIHGTFLADEELAFLAAHADRMSVVYCPRTHAFFDRGQYDVTAMLSAGVNIALGTDSRASNPDLSLLSELRHVYLQHGDVMPEEVLRLGTVRGARALGREYEVGTLAPGKRADLAVVPLPDEDAADPHALLFESDFAVATTFICGVAQHG